MIAGIEDYAYANGGFIDQQSSYEKMLNSEVSFSNMKRLFQAE